MLTEKASKYPRKVTAIGIKNPKYLAHKITIKLYFSASTKQVKILFVDTFTVIFKSEKSGTKPAEKYPTTAPQSKNVDKITKVGETVLLEPKEKTGIRFNFKKITPFIKEYASLLNFMTACQIMNLLLHK